MDRAGVKSSPEKVADMKAQLIASAGESDDEQAGQLAAVATMLAPQLEQFLPLDDAEALDALLLQGAHLFTRLRSDDAEPPAFISVSTTPPAVPEPEPDDPEW